MPDRAVVDDDEMPGCVPPHAVHPVTFEVTRVFHGEPSGAGLEFGQPRALVAVSDDQKDMVLLNKEHGWWLGFRRVTNDFKYITLACKDRGQTAEQALADWMADDE
jgi:hypothetical protein